MSDEDEIKEVISLFTSMYNDMMEKMATKALGLIHQKIAGDLLVAVVPSLANQVEHTLSATDFAKELAKAVVEFDKERMRLANEAQASTQSS